ncbi:hypothetical protein L596_004001 [Steinernema carpocapsae]|uniref:Uncharacterized protein n=1 Tax=Steinernema carpocapsae TaxID=34508 RepID=A0A4U8UXT1_STECR|nr:hypothetical protein L596_004001 [Steinernema carpocapsae]
MSGCFVRSNPVNSWFLKRQKTLMAAIPLLLDGVLSDATSDFQLENNSKVVNSAGTRQAASPNAILEVFLTNSTKKLMDENQEEAAGQVP